jgi:hypothetical protein
MSRMRGVIVHIVGLMNVIVRCAHGGHVCYLCLLPNTLRGAEVPNFDGNRVRVPGSPSIGTLGNTHPVFDLRLKSAPAPPRLMQVARVLGVTTTTLYRVLLNSCPMNRM